MFVKVIFEPAFKYKLTARFDKRNFMNISEINVYPIKSLSGASLENSLVEERGLRYDRRRMLVDEKNEFLTQREYPLMATFGVEVAPDGLRVTYEKEEKIISFEPPNETINVKIWQSKCRANVYAGEVNEWFSDRLRAKCRLVLMPEETRRIVSPFYAVRKYVDAVSFADAYPFLVIGENSLNDLNSRLEKPVPMNRFRPNFVVSDSEAFAEDNWKQIKIGATVFRVVKPCARCVITTINQENGVSGGKEPLKTLADYRAKNGKILFGQNLIAENFGERIKIGDKVKVLA